MKPRKPGRPRRSKALADVRIALRITKAEHKMWTSLAGDRPLGEWLRWLAEKEAAL